MEVSAAQLGGESAVFGAEHENMRAVQGGERFAQASGRQEWLVGVA